MNKQELEEELNLSPELIREMRILGLVRLSSTDIVVLTRTVLTVSTIELQKIFDARQERELDSIEYVEPIGLRRYLKKLGGYKPIIGKLLIGE